jgi:hypothetical protein
MGYIIKNTSGLLNTRLTDAARKKISEGKFNISYFQVGDSEVTYNALPSNYNQARSFVLEPGFNSQNSVGVPQSNKQYIKYPYLVDANSTNTYGVPFMDSQYSDVFNRAAPRGFFTGDLTSSTISWSALTNHEYVINSNYVVNMSSLNCSNVITLIENECYTDPVREPAVGDFITIFYDGKGLDDCSCIYPTPTPSASSPNQCWTTGFTFYYNPNFDNILIQFVNTGQIRNGYPVFVSTISGLLVYYDGVNWIFQYLAVNDIWILSGLTNNPIGVFEYISGDEMFTGETKCEFNSVCLEFTTESGTTQLQNFAYIDNDGFIGYYFGDSGKDDYYIEYSANTDTWVLYINDETNIFATISGSSPIGDWTSLSPDYSGITTTFGLCNNELNYSCVCYSVSATTEESTGTYLDCNYEYQELTVYEGFPVELCIITDNIQGPISEVISGDIDYTTNCTETICGPVTINNYQLDPCASPTPTPTPSATFCPTPTPSRACPPLPPADCKVNVDSCYNILTYRITRVCDNIITLDRPTPSFTNTTNCYARVLIYPPKMTEIYDSITPRPHWKDDVINFESVCGIDAFNVKVWNMNIPWSENPAGLFSNLYKDYTNFGSIDYLGSKEYFGYASNSGQTFYNPISNISAKTDTFYFNSFGDKIDVEPEEQKAIAIIHYTNQTIDNFYGEKFALQPFEDDNSDDTLGQARNFKLHIPWLMWHKNPSCCNGETFWVDPPDMTRTDLFQVHYMLSNKNKDMNNPGLRYFHLWDTHENSNGYPNRVGKVFPDDKIIIIDDEELIAAMSYKSNRNWTLPAPQISLVTPNSCGNDNNSITGILTGNSQYLHITYRLSNSECLDSNSLHSNYYSVIQGPNLNCNAIQPQNVAVRFGSEFPCLNNYNPITTTTTANICDDYIIVKFNNDNEDPIYDIELIVPKIEDINGKIQYFLDEGEDNYVLVFWDGSCWQIQIGVCCYTSVNTTYQNCEDTEYPPTNGWVYVEGDNIENLMIDLCGQPLTTTTTICPSVCNVTPGFYADKFEIICQLVDGNERPNSSEWKIIDFTDQLTNTVNGYITQESLTSSTFIITLDEYENAPTYDLNEYIPLTEVGNTGVTLNFGDEYYFYGTIETDIQATIYEMRYKINLGQSEFQVPTNPTWKSGNLRYITELSLYDNEKNLMIISKLQSPVLRQGIQQFLIKFDF